jgi:sulfide:quinone oxidoreductase
MARRDREMRVLILGAGFGGLELATCLSDALGDQVAVTLIDKSDSFVFGYSKLDVIFGKEEPAAVRLPYGAIAKPGVDFRQETILAIDPWRKRAVTDRGTYEGDVLVVALGADLDPAATPGLVEDGHEFYSVAGAERLRDVLPGFRGGSVVVAVATPHYKCPPAPSEMAFLMHDYLVERGLRDASRITLVTPFGSPLPVSAEVGGAILAELTERGIEFIGGRQIAGVEPGGRAVRLADGSAIDSDLILAVPLHVAPPVVVEAGLTEGGWIPVDKYTLTTRFPDVYAFGDVASVGVPRAGVFSEGQAKVVATQLIARQRSQATAARYEGAGVCYLELGRGAVGRVDVNFLGGPSVSAAIRMPSPALRAEKTAFGASRRARWFGLHG